MADGLETDGSEDAAASNDLLPKLTLSLELPRESLAWTLPDGTQAESPQQAAPPPLTTVQLAFYAGWTMAVLYGNLPPPPANLRVLGTAAELDPPQRRELELARLKHLLLQLSGVPAIAPADLAGRVPAAAADHDGQAAGLVALHLAILQALASVPAEVAQAYELGRALRDTVNPPVVQSGLGQPAPASSRKWTRQAGGESAVS
jgi:hypothetical protein